LGTQHATKNFQDATIHLDSIEWVMRNQVFEDGAGEAETIGTKEPPNSMISRRTRIVLLLRITANKTTAI